MQCGLSKRQGQVKDCKLLCCEIISKKIHHRSLQLLAMLLLPLQAILILPHNSSETETFSMNYTIF